MKLHAYLESLIGSKASISLIRALVNYKDKVFTIRKLAEAAGISPGEAALTVQQLEKYGAVTLQPVGRSYLVSLNDKSYVVRKILKPIIEKENETLDDLVSTLKRNLSGKEIVSAVLFGSVPRGDEREDSDTDVLIVSNDFDAASLAVSKAQEEVSSIFHSRLSPLILSENELRTKKADHLVRSILQKYVTIAGKDLREMIER